VGEAQGRWVPVAVLVWYRPGHLREKNTRKEEKNSRLLRKENTLGKNRDLKKNQKDKPPERKENNHMFKEGHFVTLEKGKSKKKKMRLTGSP